jgi:hypothetical protein
MSQKTKVTDAFFTEKIWKFYDIRMEDPTPASKLNRLSVFFTVYFKTRYEIIP